MARRTSRSLPVQPSSLAFGLFLMTAAIGLLFTGCSKIRGPSDIEEAGFTEEDYAQMQASSGSSGSAEGIAGGLAVSSIGASADAVSVDLSWIPVYDAIRAVAGNGEYVVSNDFVNVRSAADPKSTFVDRLERGTKLSVLEFPTAAWAKINYGGKTGYVASQYLSKLSTEETLAEDRKAFEGKYFVDYAFVNMRREPNQQSEKIGEVPGKAIVTPTSLSDSWAKVSYGGQEGYVSTQYLTPFSPSFVVRQEHFQLPVIVFQAADPDLVAALPQYLAALKAKKLTLMNLRTFGDLLIAQQERDVRLNPNSVAIGVSGLDAANIKKVSDIFTAEGVPATLFVASKELNLSGITEKMVLTLLANGFDLQSATHSGNDLRTLSSSQVADELRLSRKVMEDLTHEPVRAVYYPMGGVNDRIVAAAKDAGFLLGIGSGVPETFGRSQLLMIPGLTVTGAMKPEDVAVTAESAS